VPRKGKSWSALGRQVKTGDHSAVILKKNAVKKPCTEGTPGGKATRAGTGRGGKKEQTCPATTRNRARKKGESSSYRYQ